jgi:hypothetical protein
VDGEAGGDRGPADDGRTVIWFLRIDWAQWAACNVEIGTNSRLVVGDISCEILIISSMDCYVGLGDILISKRGFRRTIFA